jgi:hypothetical protein
MKFPIRRRERAVPRQLTRGRVMPAALKGSTQMRFNLKGLAAIAAVAVLGFLAPAASASAAVTSTPVAARSLAYPGFGLGPFFGLGGLSFVGPSVAPGAFGVVGPTVYTVGDANVFVGTTITTTAGGAIVGAGPAG